MIVFGVMLVLVLAISINFVGWWYFYGFIAWDHTWWAWLIGNMKRTWLFPMHMAYSALAGMSFFVMGSLILSLWYKRVRTRTVHGDFANTALHGTARFATMRDVVKMGLINGTGVVLGYFNKKRLAHDGPEHVLVFAPTRSGKGVSVVIPTLLEWEQSAFVLDIKGELFQLTSGYRAKLGQRIICFDPSNVHSHTFNPLSEVRVGTSHFVSDVQRLVAILVDPYGKEADKYFTPAGYSWLSAVTMHLIVRQKKSDKPTPTFADVATFMSAREFSDYDDGSDGAVKAMCQSMIEYDHGEDNVNTLIHNKANEIKTMPDKKRGGVFGTASMALEVFQDPVVSKNTAQSDFTVDSLMEDDSPTTLYFLVPPADIKRLQPLIKMVFETIIMKRTNRMDGNTKPKQRLLLLMDEFTSIGKVTVFAEAIAFIAGYGMKFVGIIQDFNQLHSTYGKEESISSNCHIRLAFAPNRLETAKTLSDMMGKTTVVTNKRGTSGIGLNRSVSDSSNEVGRPLMTPEEIMSMRGIEKGSVFMKDKPGQALVFVAGQPPILVDQGLYYQDTSLRARTEIPAVCL